MSCVAWSGDTRACCAKADEPIDIPFCGCRVGQTNLVLAGGSRSSTEYDNLWVCWDHIRTSAQLPGCSCKGRCATAMRPLPNYSRQQQQQQQHPFNGLFLPFYCRHCAIEYCCHAWHTQPRLGRDRTNEKLAGNQCAVVAAGTLCKILK